MLQVFGQYNMRLTGFTAFMAYAFVQNGVVAVEDPNTGLLVDCKMINNTLTPEVCASELGESVSKGYTHHMGGPAANYTG